jgi:hypothetical protein
MFSASCVLLVQQGAKFFRIETHSNVFASVLPLANK